MDEPQPLVPPTPPSTMPLPPFALVRCLPVRVAAGLHLAMGAVLVWGWISIPYISIASVTLVGTIIHLGIIWGLWRQAYRSRASALLAPWIIIGCTVAGYLLEWYYFRMPFPRPQNSLYLPGIRMGIYTILSYYPLGPYITLAITSTILLCLPGVKTVFRNSPEGAEAASHG